MLRNPFLYFCSAVAAVFIYFVFYYEAHEWPSRGRDMCAYERTFNNCLSAAKTNGVASENVVSQCSQVAQNISYRSRAKIKPECLQ